MEYEDFLPFKRKLELHAEMTYNDPDLEISTGSKYRAWFIAPKTTNYRFKVGCDDICSFAISETPDSTDNMTILVDELSNAWSTRRYY
jgi:hypothetical protein